MGTSGIRQYLGGTSAEIGSLTASLSRATVSSSSSGDLLGRDAGATTARPELLIPFTGGGAGGARTEAEVLADLPPPPREKIKFGLRDLTLHATVGTGTFGRVRVVQYKPTRQWYALKILKKSEILRLKQLAHITSEVRVLSRIYHPFIVNMMGHIQDDRRLYMLFEYVPGGELFSHLRREGKFVNDRARFYAAQIVLAFEYLHCTNIVYRDLKPENLLLTAKGNIKITDFGFAKVVEDRTYTLCGTPEYLAPEIIQQKGHNKAVDWWAIGILIYEMLAGYPPFFDETPFAIYQKILAGRYDFPRHFTPEARDLIRKLLVPDRTKRLGCMHKGPGEIKAHPWWIGLDWDAVFNCRVPAPFLPAVRDEKDTSNFDSYPESDDDGESTPRLPPAQASLFVEFDSF